MTVSAVSPVGYSNFNFKANTVSAPQTSNPKEYDVISIETEASTGKKWGVGIASAFLPGLGQAINGQWGKGFGFLLGTGAMGVASIFSALSGNLKTALVGSLATTGLELWSIIDAVKSAKSEVKQIVPKEPGTSNLNVVA